MLTIRLLRIGKKNQPFFRLIVCDKKNPPRGGRFIEIIGFLNPLTKEKKLKKERIEHWLKQGAKPSETVHNWLIKEGILKGKKIALNKKSKKKEKPGETEANPKEVSLDKGGAAPKPVKASSEQPAEPQEMEKPTEIK